MTRWFSFRRVLAIAGKEFFHLRRDRLTGGMVAGIPLMMTLLFGYAINQDVRHLSGAVYDEAGSRESRALVQAAQATQVIDIKRYAQSISELEHWLVTGEILIGIVIPHDYESRRQTGDRTPAQLLVSAADPVVLSAARSLTALPIPGRIPADANAVPATFALRAYFNPERRSPVFIVPGLTGVILTLTMVLFTAIAIVRERERGNLELLITTPVRSLELMVGKILPYVVIGYVQVTLILLLGVFLFNVPIAGNLGDFFVGAGLFVLSVLTLGLMISTVASSQFQAFQLNLVTFLPQLLLSGYMFPFEGMPRPAQWLAELFPLTHFLRIARGILLRGATLADLNAQLWPLLAFFLVMLLLSALRFRKRLD
ncbi:MAG: ABC transporter permease [Gammaproteobacteria bacterium]|nr:ABC transporter permease [Gammaproteobacteria bacterium]